MKNWKVILLFKGRIMHIEIEAMSYADAYIKTQIAYPDCRIKSITEIRIS